MRTLIQTVTELESLVNNSPSLNIQIVSKSTLNSKQSRNLETFSGNSIVGKTENLKSLDSNKPLNVMSTEVLGD